MSAATGKVDLEIQGSIARLTFDRASARNAMTWAMYEQLESHLERLADAKSVRATILRGSSQTFVAGTDIALFAPFSTAQDGLIYERRLESIVARLESARMPTLAVLDGHATGAGLIFAAVCDLRICTPNARFGMPIARTVGNCLSIANHARLIAVFGTARTKAMILTAETLSAADALACGFVTEIVPPDEIDARAAQLCERIAANAPITVAITREAVRRITHSQLPVSDDLLRLAYGSRDFHEGVAAFLAKRPPHWQGE